MRWKKAVVASGLASLGFLAAPALADDPGPDPRSKEKTALSEAKRAEAVKAEASAPRETAQPAVDAGLPFPIYKPPEVGKPSRTVGGGSRGSRERIPLLYALVPNHVAQTTAAQPSLFWFVDSASPKSAKMQFTLLDEDGIEPLVETSIPTPKSAGIHRIRLSDFGVELQPGIEYEWSVALILDPEDRSRDIVATGWIDRVERTARLEQQLETEGQARAVHVYADQGLWYDALTALDDRISTQPGNRTLVAMRSSLLKQVGLDAASEGEV